MIKHIIALITIVLAAWSYIYMAKLDSTVNKVGNIQKLIASTAMEDTKLTQKETPVVQTQNKVQNSTKSSKDKEVEDKLRALKEKAGNIAAFNVSPLYKKNCSSCHGNIGQGIIGPKLIGKTEEVILKDLQDFKSGKRKNYVMYGLLGNMNNKQLASLAKEIGTFQSKLDAATK